jgi:hypothetical protein
MLEYKLADGSIFMLDNLISLLVTIGAMYYICYREANQKDKAAHAALSALIVLSTLILLHLADLKAYWWTAPVVGTIFGIGKEIWDKINPKKRLFDWRDVGADMVGVVWITTVYFLSFYIHSNRMH